MAAPAADGGERGKEKEKKRKKKKKRKREEKRSGGAHLSASVSIFIITRRQRCCPVDRDMFHHTWLVRIYTCGV